MYKAMIDNFLISNYSKLNSISKSYCMGTNMPSDDLTCELVIYLYENEIKVSPFLNSPTSLIRFSKKWLWNQVKVYTKNSGLTNFKSKFQIFDAPEIDSNISNGYDHSDLISEYEYDLSRVYTHTQIDKIIFSRQILKQLTSNERRLFYLHYDQMLSHIEIANYLEDKYRQKCSASSVYNLIVSLRIKIKTLYDISTIVNTIVNNN